MLPHDLEQLVRARNPGFRCVGAGRLAKGSFIARIRHILKSPAPPRLLEFIHERLGDYATSVADFYSEHNGFILYHDTLSDAAGFELLPVEQWQQATSDMHKWFGDLAEEPGNDPDRIATGVAIATVPQSGNHFVVPIEGPNAGKIFYADHDGWYESAFAQSFEDMLIRLSKNPVRLLNEEFGCYTRYSDGKTDIQWIPEEYFPDATQIPG
jgi:hypothetical protein